LLAQTAGLEYHCVAWPGIGNEGISRTIIVECEQSVKQDIFVFVIWSSPGRYEFRFKYDTRQLNSPWYTFDKWTFIDNVEDIKKDFINDHEDNKSILNRQIKTINNAKASGVSDFAKFFYKNVGDSEYWEIYTSLKEIVYLQNYLKINNIAYLFSCVDTSIFYNYTIDNADTFILSLYKQIDFDRWFLFPSIQGNQKGFKQWALDNKYPAGALHPLEDAHRDAAELIKEKFNELVKKSI
jgi:hypothetical protein